MRRALFILILMSSAAARPPAANPVDQYFEKYWKERGVTPAAPADDYEFLRRLSFDVLGRPPRPDEIRAFVASRDRARKIDELLNSPEAAGFFADTWMRLLLNYRFDETAPLKMNFPAFHAYLKEIYAKDVPYRDFVTQLLSDHGEYVKKPATNFVLIALDPKEPPYELTDRTLRLFLGIPIQCARCHDHPFEKYTQGDYWGLTAFFSGLKAKARTTFDGFGVKLMSETNSMMRIPDTETQVEARYLDGRKPAPSEKPLAALAGFVTEDARFPRAIVNRLWMHFMGRGFVEPVDRFSDRAKPTHPELLETLGREFEKNGARLRPLMKTILNSCAYQASCATIQDVEPTTHATMPLKTPTPVQMLNTLKYALNLDVFLEQFYKSFYENKALPEVYRNPEVFKIYLHIFMQGLLAPSGIVPEETRYTGSVRLALKLMNAHDLQNLVKAEWGRLAEILKEDDAPDPRIENIFLTLLARPPSAEERGLYMAYLEKKKNGKRAYEDIYWTLLNSTEFYFNH